MSIEAQGWMKKLTKNYGDVASSLPDPALRVLEMPSPSLTWAVGNNGVLEGKSILLYGPEQGGKSLLMQLMLIS